MSAKPKHRTKQARCKFTSSDGRRCRLLRAEGHNSLCLKHWRRELRASEPDPQSPEAHALVAHFLGARDEFKTSTSINNALAKLFALRSRGLIGHRDAALLAYIAQLLLISLGGVQQEFLRLRDYHDWDNLLERALRTAKQRLPRLKSDPAVHLPDLSLPADPAPDRATARASARESESDGLPPTRRQFARQVFAQMADQLRDPDVSDDGVEEEEADAAEVQTDA